MTRYILNKNNIELLCAALESGQYAKGKGVLHRVIHQTTNIPSMGAVEPGDYWCCLGVGSHVAALHGVKLSREFYDHEPGDGTDTVGSVEFFGSTVSDSTSFAFPWAVIDFYGFDSFNPSLCLDDGTIMSAADVNDEGWKGKDYTLPEIGALFRATYIDCDGPRDRQSKINANKESK